VWEYTVKKIALGLGALLLGMAALVWLLNTRDEPDLSAATVPSTPALLARGAYLAQLGNCAACHTLRGGTPYAGGRGIGTPFGTVYSSNLTPDVQTGIGNWSPAEFWRALHNGRSKDGRLLYPAFPYASYTTLTRADADAPCTVCPPHRSPPHRTRCAGRSTSRRHWRCGGRCTSAPPVSSRNRPSRRLGTGARIW
jgi:mono/diheme cytochrome c family protein